MQAQKANSIKARFLDDAYLLSLEKEETRFKIRLGLTGDSLSFMKLSQKPFTLELEKILSGELQKEVLLTIEPLSQEKLTVLHNEGKINISRAKAMALSEKKEHLKSQLLSHPLTKGLESIGAQVVSVQV